MVDSGSRDGTVALAERHGARVIAQGMAGFRPAEAVRGVGRAQRLGALPGRRRARHARARREPRARRSPRPLQGVPHGAPQPLPRPLARARRGLPGLVAAPLPPGARRAGPTTTCTRPCSPPPKSGASRATCCTIRPRTWPPTSPSRTATPRCTPRRSTGRACARAMPRLFVTRWCASSSSTSCAWVSSTAARVSPTSRSAAATPSTSTSS